MNKIGMHCYVSGKVQGVWFRSSTEKQAKYIGLVGWVRNLSDGRVEVMAFGEKEKISQLYEWLKKGPPLAQVTDLSYEELPWEDHKTFEVL